MEIIAKLLGSYLIAPATWITLLLFAGLIIKQKNLKKRLLLSSAILYLFFTNQLISSFIIGNFQPKAVTIKDSANYSCGILLNGFLLKDDKGRTFFTEDGDRFIQTVQLYHRGVIKKILTLGGSAESVDFKAGDYGKEELIKAGVKAEDIMVDNSSVNTYEGGDVCKKILDSLAPPYVLITSAYHMPRSKMIFDKKGIQTISYPCDFWIFSDGFSFKSLIIPDPYSLFKWQLFFREIVGMAYYKIK